MESAYFTSSDGKELRYRIWRPENGNIQFSVQILHGMAEHSRRYDRFAQYLTTLGAVVYAHDHRGHGESAEDDELGYFAPRFGWQRVVDETVEISRMVNESFPEIPHFLFGHSMGSFIARSVIIEHSEAFSGVILSGTAADKGLLAKVGKGIAVVKSTLNGGKRPDPFLDNLSFGSFARHFPDRQSEFDWLSKDREQVEAYLNDPLCGFICTSRFFVDLLDGIALANNARQASFIRNDLPIFLISGENDPVGDFSEGVKKVFNLYRKQGISDLSMHIVKGGRHELLNETNYQEIHTTIGAWLTERAAKGKRR